MGVRTNPKKCSEFKTLNDFFSRGMADGRRPNLPNGSGKVGTNKRTGYAPLISAADSRVMVYETIKAATKFWVKEQEFNLGVFLGTDSMKCDADGCYFGCTHPQASKVNWLKFRYYKLFNKNKCGNCNGTGGVSRGVTPAGCTAKEYEAGLLYQEPDIQEGIKEPSMVIFRLAPQDYHRFHYAVSGTVIDHYAIKGSLFSVNPGAVNNPKFKVFQENNGKSCVEIGSTIKAGGLHGKMRYGGSTVVYLFEDGMVDFDEALLNRCKVGDTWSKEGVSSDSEDTYEWPGMETYYQVSELLGKSTYKAAPPASD